METRLGSSRLAGIEGNVWERCGGETAGGRDSGHKGTRDGALMGDHRQQRQQHHAKMVQHHNLADYFDCHEKQCLHFVRVTQAQPRFRDSQLRIEFSRVVSRDLLGLLFFPKSVGIFSELIISYQLIQTRKLIHVVHIMWSICIILK